MLAQSVLDGYNVCPRSEKFVHRLTMGQVCIFAYGQTGSGKSWTMEGGLVSELPCRAGTSLLMCGRATRMSA